jgi:hypothetical protein
MREKKGLYIRKQKALEEWTKEPSHKGENGPSIRKKMAPS